MRKRLQLFFILLIGIFYKGQDNTLAASVNTPASYQTGVPDISFPLVSLPATKDMNINFGLAYNVNAYMRGDYSGIIGRNWSLTGSNYSIKRQVVSNIADEVYTFIPEHFDDIYYYNLNGEQGSFRFERTGIYPNDTYKIIKLTPSNIIIESERIQINSSVTPRWLKSIVIKDSKGYKYYFTEYDQTMTMYESPTGSHYPEYQRNELYVTRIEDATGRTIASFTNKKYIKYKDNSNDTIIESFYYLPEKIETAYGSITFEHGNSNDDISMDVFPLSNSRYIQSITLRDNKGIFISRSNLDVATSYYNDTNYFSNIYYRALSGISRTDRNGNTIDKIAFGYKSYTRNSYGNYLYNYGYSGYSGTGEEKAVLMDLLHEVVFSSGKKIEYEFKFNKSKSPIDFNTPSFINSVTNPDYFISGICFLRELTSIAIDTKIAKRYYLPASLFKHGPNTRLYVGFDRTDFYPNDTGGPPMLSGENNLGQPLPVRFDYQIVDPITGKKTLPIDVDGRKAYVITPGHSVYLEVLGSGGKGYFHIEEKDYSPPPYSNTIEGGLTIDSIKYYNAAENSIPGYIYYDLKKSISYDYSLFDGSGLSSGVPETNFFQETIIYNNLKITESDKKGYSKYYFKTTEDYPPYELDSDNNVWPNYNLIKNGLLSKKEVYDVNNIKRHETLYGYSFPPYDANNQYLVWFSSMENFKFYTTESFFDKITTTDKSFDSNGNTLTDISEKSFNQSNNNLMGEKRTSADGTVSETTYQYAAEKNNTKLLGANMFSVPLEVTQKQNGLPIGKLETRYDQTGNYFPSSVRSFGINNVVTGEQVNDLYDPMGNVLQTTSKTGMPTAIIWGYGNTQPIAKIEGAQYYQVLSLMGQPDVSQLDIVQRSNLDVDSSNNANEQLLRDALEAFRRKPEFKNFLITSYTYDPLIGVKSMTTPNGFTEYYYYDNQNRPSRVEDSNHHVIRENKYQQNVFQDPN